MSKGQQTYNIFGIPVVAGTKKAAMKKYRKVQHLPAVKEHQALMQAIAEQMMKQHHWYVDLVVVSKVMEKEGRELTLEEMKERCRRVHTLDGQEHITFDGNPLISYNRVPRFEQERNMMLMDYIR